MAKSIGFPTLSKDEKAKASERIAHHLDHAEDHPGGHEQAIAIGLREAAPEKYDKFKSRGTGPKKAPDAAKPGAEKAPAEAPEDPGAGAGDKE